MMHNRARAAIIPSAFVLAAGALWWFFIPSNIGGLTTYVITHGVSMLPLFHSGDLALVRAASHYRIGDIVAYHSSPLHEVVLHRIVAVHDGHFTIKGDNNHFLDPVRPTASAIVGKLWLHARHGGVALRALHSPVVAGVLLGSCGLLVLGEGETRRRRGRGRRGARPTTGGSAAVKPERPTRRGAVHLAAVLTASVIAALLFLGLGVIAFAHPLDKTSLARTPYTQQIRFGYRASAPAGAVYPTGIVATGDPIFLALVHRVRFDINYRLATGAPHQLRGTEQVFLTLTGPSGWSRSVPLGPLRRFAGPAVRTQVTVDLPSVQSLINRVQQLTGVSAAAGYTLAVAPQVHIRGELAGQAVDTSFAPALSFQLGALQLQPASASPAGSSPSGGGSDPSQAGTVSTPTSTANSVRVLGHALSVAALRSVAVIGFLLSAALALIATVVKRVRPLDEAVRIQAQYGQLIVPVVLGPDELGVAPVDVPTIAALARLAESGQRLILHSRNERRDTYLVNDEGTVYRYRADPGNVVWGEWSATAPRPLAHVAASAMAPAPAPAFATSGSATVVSEPLVAAVQTPSIIASTPEVFPPPPFLFAAPTEAPTEARPSVHETPAASEPRPVRPSPQPGASATPSARPRLRSWMKSQAERARVVRELGSAILGTGER
jgi:signal peptidase I